VRPEARGQRPEARGQMPDARCQMPDARCQMPDARCQMPDAWSVGFEDFGVICTFASWECCIIDDGLASFCTVCPNVSFFLLNVEFGCSSIKNWCLVGLTE